MTVAKASAESFSAALVSHGCHKLAIFSCCEWSPRCNWITRMFEGTDSPELTSQLSPIQFAKAFVDSAVQTRYNAVAQLAETAHLNLPKMNLVEDIDRNTLAAKVGSVAGEAVDMLLLSRFTKAVGKAAFGKLLMHDSPISSGAHLGVTGSLYGGILTPVNVEQGKEQWKERFKSAVTDGLSIGAMGAMSNGLTRTAMFGNRSLASGLTVGALSGAVAGVADAQSRSLMSGKGFASFSETAADSANFAAFGAIFAGAGRAVDAAVERVGQRAEIPRLAQEKTNAVAVKDGLTVGKLEAAFGEPLVRVRLRWDLLKKLDSPVSTHVFTEHQALSSLYHPWYNDSAGKIVGWDSADARPLSVSDVAANQTSITAQRFEHIQQTGALLSTFDNPVQITALGYKLPGDKHFLLDSNHRIAAVAAARLPFRLIVHSINGPVNGEYLPDLVQFDDSSSGSRLARTQAIQKVREQNGW